jgi:hypothetical protein
MPLIEQKVINLPPRFVYDEMRWWKKTIVVNV